MIELRKFEEADIARLINWIQDARVMAQWARQQYQYPLDRAQLLKSIERTRGGDRPAHLMFAACRQDDGTAVGHIELMRVDYGNGSARLGRVLIGRDEDRGRGLGSAMVAEALNYSFNILGLMEIKLEVFSCNKPAMACFIKNGFSGYEFRENVQQFEYESWNLLLMKLSRHKFTECHHIRQFSEQLIK